MISKHYESLEQLSINCVSECSHLNCNPKKVIIKKEEDIIIKQEFNSSLQNEICRSVSKKIHEYDETLQTLGQPSSKYMRGIECLDQNFQGAYTELTKFIYPPLESPVQEDSSTVLFNLIKYEDRREVVVDSIKQTKLQKNIGNNLFNENEIFKCARVTSTSEKERLLGHIPTHPREKPFKCATCTYSASQKRNLVRHMRTHSGEKLFCCASCNYRAAEKRNLLRHIRTHIGDKPFKCARCTYSTSDRTNLVRHSRIHIGEKPFKCASCYYSASDKSNLVQHIRTHTGERPFKCEMCNYSSSKKTNLVKHIRIHSAKFSLA